MKNLEKIPDNQDSLWTLGSTIFVAILAFPVTIISASILGSGGIGSLKIIHTIVDFSLRSDFGLTKSFAREIPILAGKKDHERTNYLTNLTITTSLVSTLIFIALVGTAYSFNISFNGAVQSLNILLLLLIFILVERINAFVGKSVAAHGHFIVQSKARLYRAILYPIVVIPLITYFSLEGAILGIILARIFDVSYILKNAGHKFSFVWNFSEVLGLQKIGIRLWSINLSNLIINSIEVVLISSFLGLKLTGIYGFALGAMSLFRSFPESQSSIFYRKYAVKTGEESERKDHYQDALLTASPFFMFVTMFFCFAGYTAYAFCVYVFLPEFIDSLIVMLIILPGCVIFSSKLISSIVMNLLNYFRPMLLIPVFMIVIQVIMSIILIQNFGIYGAAVSYSSCLLFSGLLYTFIAAKKVFSDMKHISLIVFKQMLVSLLSFISIIFFYYYNPINPIDVFSFREMFEIIGKLAFNFIFCCILIIGFFTLCYPKNFYPRMLDFIKETLTSLKLSSFLLSK